MKGMVLGLVGFLISALACGPAGAWSHAGRFGTASGGAGAAVASANTAAGTTYYHCGTTWFQPSYGANGVYYRVVPAP